MNIISYELTFIFQGASLIHSIQIMSQIKEYICTNTLIYFFNQLCESKKEDNCIFVSWVSVEKGAYHCATGLYLYNNGSVNVSRKKPKIVGDIKRQILG